MKRFEIKPENLKESPDPWVSDASSIQDYMVRFTSTGRWRRVHLFNGNNAHTRNGERAYYYVTAFRGETVQVVLPPDPRIISY